MNDTVEVGGSERCGLNDIVGGFRNREIEMKKRHIKIKSNKSGKNNYFIRLAFISVNIKDGIFLMECGMACECKFRDIFCDNFKHFSHIFTDIMQY